MEWLAAHAAGWPGGPGFSRSLAAETGRRLWPGARRLCVAFFELYLRATCHRTLSATHRWPPPLRRCLSHIFNSIASIHRLLSSRPTAPFASDSRSKHTEPRRHPSEKFDKKKSRAIVVEETLTERARRRDDREAVHAAVGLRAVGRLCH